MYMSNIVDGERFDDIWKYDCPDGVCAPDTPVPNPPEVTPSPPEETPSPPDEIPSPPEEGECLIEICWWEMKSGMNQA